MNKLTCDPLGDHLWRDINGPVGWLLGVVFCAFLILPALVLVAFALLILLMDHVVLPLRSLLGRPSPAAPEPASGRSGRDV